MIQVKIDHITDLTLYPMTIYPICSAWNLQLGWTCTEPLNCKWLWLWVVSAWPKSLGPLPSYWDRARHAEMARDIIKLHNLLEELSNNGPNAARKGTKWRHTFSGIHRLCNLKTDKIRLLQIFYDPQIKGRYKGWVSLTWIIIILNSNPTKVSNSVARWL